MGSRLKEEEKNEKAIRSLLRKTPNRRCINCNSMGPQYVCLNFWTFVCTQCSGIHREFTHRVKSVSMSKFTSQEVANLESGGNERARETFFKDWDSQRQPLPDSSNVDRLRDFIKMVYVDRRFSGERPLPRGGGGDREGSSDSSRPRPNYRPDSRSPPYEDRYDERPPGGRRSNTGYDDRRWEERGSRYDEKSSPGRFESERNRNDRGYNDNRGYDARSRYDNRDRQQYYEEREGANRRLEDRFANERGARNYGGASPPPVYPVKEILGEDAPPLRVESPGRQSNGGRSQDERRQRFGSSSSFGSVDGNAPAGVPTVKREEPTSLIDFSTEPDPPVAALQQSHPRGVTSSYEQSADASSSTGWATFDMFSTAPAAPAPSSVAPGAATGVSGGFTTSQGSHTNGDSTWATQWTATSIPSTLEVNPNSWSSTLAATTIPATSLQSWNTFQASASGTSFSSAPPVPAAIDVPSVTSFTGVAPTVGPVQPAGRSEIPQDFFSGPTSNLQFMGTSSLGPQYPSMSGMGMFAGNYNQSFEPHQPTKSMNPFDLPGYGPSVGPAVNEFPNLAPLQAALPNAHSFGPLPSSAGPGLARYGPQWSQPNSVARPPQAFYSPGLVPQAGGLFVSQQPPQIMQSLPLGPSGGASLHGGGGGVSMPMGFINVPKQGADTLFPSSNFSAPQRSFGGGNKQGVDALFPPSSFPSLPSQNSFGGGTDAFFTAQGAQFSHPNPAALHATSAVGPPFRLGQAVPSAFPQHRLLSQGSLGSLSSLSGPDSLFPSQPPLPGQQLVSHSSLGSLNNMMGLDNQFPLSAAQSQFPGQSSGGSNGNPFG